MCLIARSLMTPVLDFFVPCGNNAQRKKREVFGSNGGTSGGDIVRYSILLPKDSYNLTLPIVVKGVRSIDRLIAEVVVLCVLLALLGVMGSFVTLL